MMVCTYTSFSTSPATIGTAAGDLCGRNALSRINRTLYTIDYYYTHTTYTAFIDGGWVISVILLPPGKIDADRSHAEKTWRKRKNGIIDHARGPMTVVK